MARRRASKKNLVIVAPRKSTITKAKQSSAKKRTTRRRKVDDSSSGLLPTIGGIAGSYLAGPAGGAVGVAAGKMIARITGFGDYKVERNSVSNGNSVPTFRSGGEGMRICHREFLSDVMGSVGFSNTVYPLNPGLITTFPWLSLLAANFEEYDFHGLVFEYRPSSGTAVSATSSALGIVILATDYDAANVPFTNKQQMESYEFSTSTVPFTACIHPVECARGRNVLNNLYTRTGSIPVNTDIRMYDAGNFQIAAVGMQSAYTVGELWVSYDVSLNKPRLPASVPRAAYSRMRANPPATAVAAGPYGTSGLLIATDSNLGITPSSTNGFYIPFAGKYFIVSLFKSATTITNVTTSIGTNLSAGANLLNNNTNSYVLYMSNLIACIVQLITVVNTGNDSKNLITYNVAGLSSGDTDVLVFQLHNTMPVTGVVNELVRRFSDPFVEVSSMRTLEQKS